MYTLSVLDGQSPAAAVLDLSPLVTQVKISVIYYTDNIVLIRREHTIS